MSALALHASGTAPVGFDELMRNVRALAPQLAARGEEIEQVRRLPADVVEQLRAAGVFRAAFPQAQGGPGLTSMQQIELVEELAAADAAVGWCAMIGMDSGIYAGYLPPTGAQRLYPHPDLVTAGWVAPVGRALEVEGGYLVDGHWRFGSGCTHADVIAGGCTVHRDGAPLRDTEGRPVVRMVLAPAACFEVEDTWHTTGLAGTGSCDYRAKGLFVPADQTFSFEQPWRDEPLYRRCDAIVRKMPGVPLGVARTAIDFTLALAEHREDGPGQPWRSSARVQTVLAECVMRRAAARAAVYASVEALWRRMEAGQEPTPRERAEAALARYDAFRTARRIVAELYDLVGTQATFRARTPLERALRDLTTACQHVVGQHRVLEWSGQLLLGGETDAAFV
ncbi:alkylation response protein AidB-like acyl-CoA dehydrogenase [Streptacidiphilus sp. MAP12-33]|uniref:acyl-CoA dehydrogenase family protein n=1 Tax=Streptacidiphilus sp. MAP12-33 TaxID=3156266 RepID=UPI003513E7C4